MAGGRAWWLAALGASLIGAALGAGAFWTVGALRTPTSDLHELLHARIPLGPEEEARLEAQENTFQQKRAAIERRITAANRKLAAAIRTDPRWSPAVEAASAEVEAAAGELQRITLEHVFEMRAGLDEQHRPAYDDVLIEALQRGTR